MVATRAMPPRPLPHLDFTRCGFVDRISTPHGAAPPVDMDASDCHPYGAGNLHCAPAAEGGPPAIQLLQEHKLYIERV